MTRNVGSGGKVWQGLADQLSAARQMGKAVLLAIGIGGASLVGAAPVELPQPKVIESSSGTFNVVIRATNQSSVTLPVGDPASASPLPALQVDGLYLYKTGTCSGCKASLLPARINAKPGQTFEVRLNDGIGPVPAGESKVTNLHTHGLIVPVNHAASACATRGDDVLIVTSPNSPVGNCMDLGPMTMGDDTMQMAKGPLNYSYQVPTDHPGGLYWYHPHPHGFSEAQVGGGMSGLITIGDFWDTAFITCAPTGTQAATEHPNKRCTTVAKLQKELAARSNVEQRFLMLKDFQIARQPSGRYQRSGYDKAFCGAPTSGTVVPNTHRGYCTDDANTGRWAFTVNGVVYPTITVARGKSHVWRIANASADAAYHLQVVVTSGNAAVPAGTVLPLRLLAQDGSTLASVGTTQWTAKDIVMMPSARAEILLDACAMGLGRIVAGQCRLPAGTIKAELRTLGADVAATPGGADIWPAMSLAEVVFVGGGPATPREQFNIETIAPKIRGGSAAATTPAAGPTIAVAAAGAPPAALTSPCTPSILPSDRGRVVRFKNGVLATSNERFGLRTETSRINLPGNSSVINLPDLTPSPDLATDYSQIEDANSKSRLCIKHGQQERWVLINDSEECHNFHIHQMRFKVRRIQAGGTPADQQCLGNRSESIANDAWHDNFPLPPGARVLIDIAFDRPEHLGKYVYHCHILEHEDKGMMAVVEVVP
jgi:FtsP/CotA-like multicopper oxidase with cupredoxin domain